MPFSLCSISGTSRHLKQMIHPEGQKKGWEETGSYPAMLLLIRSCKIKFHNNVPRSFCPERLTGTRLDVALPLISALSSGGTGGLWPAQGRPLTWSSAASICCGQIQWAKAGEPCWLRRTVKAPGHRVNVLLANSMVFQFLEQEFARKVMDNENSSCKLPTYPFHY